MSLVAIWQNAEEPEQASIWVVTDSRISDAVGVLLDEGTKLFSVPIVCRGPGDDGFFSLPYFVQDVGLACVGGTLLYQHVYACMVPVLSSLIGDGLLVPSLEDVAETTATITSKYVVSLAREILAHTTLGSCYSATAQSTPAKRSMRSRRWLKTERFGDLSRVRSTSPTGKRTFSAIMSTMRIGHST